MNSRIVEAFKKMGNFVPRREAVRNQSLAFFRLRLVLIPIILAAICFLIVSIYFYNILVTEVELLNIENDALIGQNFLRFIQNEIVLRVIPISIIIFLIFIIVGVIILNRLFDPISQLASAARQLETRKFDISIPLDAPGEVGILAQAFDQMRNELQGVLLGLEDRVFERTRELATKTIQLQTAAEIAREVISTRNFDTLLNRAVNLMVERFYYYHVGIYLINPQGDYAVLHAASGQIGKEMIAQGHRLGLGPSSTIGYVANTGEARIVLNVDKDVYYYRNPLLPKTKSELALPLVIDQRVIGVLDVLNSDRADFSQDEKDVLQILADQLAIAIDTARLYQEHIELRHQFERLEFQIGQEVWMNISKSKKFSAYQIDASGLQPLSQADLDKDVEIPPYSFPIKVRGETVSYLDIWPIGSELTLYEKTMLDLLLERLSQAVESARLFEETHKRASREQSVNDFVSKLSSSIDLDSLMQAAIKELGSLPGIAEVEIRLDPMNKKDFVSSANSEEIV